MNKETTDFIFCLFRNLTKTYGILSSSIEATNTLIDICDNECISFYLLFHSNVHESYFRNRIAIGQNPKWRKVMDLTSLV